MTDKYRSYPVSIFPDFDSSETWIQIDIVFRINKCLFLLIFINRCRLCVTFDSMSELSDHSSKPLVRSYFDMTSKMDTHLCTIVSSKNRTVIDQSHLASKTRCSDSSTHTCNSTTDNHNLVFLDLRGWQRQHHSSERLQFGKRGRRKYCRVSCQEQCIAPAVKTGHIA